MMIGAIGRRATLRASRTLLIGCALCPLTCPLAPGARAGSSDKFHITPQEKAACSSDAIRFCLHTYPDEDQLLVCMKQNRDALTATCRIAFDAGIKRRRL